MQNIYVLNLLRIVEQTKESLNDDLKMENFKYNKNITLDRYIERICSFNQYASKYKLILFEENAYFLNLEDAQERAKENCCDINEAGVYNYVCIIEYPIGKMYATCEPSDFYLYKYNSQKDEYDEVSSNEEVYKFTAIDVGASAILR